MTSTTPDPTNDTATVPEPDPAPEFEPPYDGPLAHTATWPDGAEQLVITARATDPETAHRFGAQAHTVYLPAAARDVDQVDTAIQAVGYQRMTEWVRDEDTQVWTADVAPTHGQQA